MPSKTHHRIQVVSYIPPTEHEQLEAARLRAQRKAGHTISVSTYVAQILKKHVSRLTAAQST